MALQYGGWEIAREIGKGSFGTVYEITKEEFGHTYRAALKVIHIPQEKGDVDQVRGLGMSEADITEYYQEIAEDCVREIVLMSQMQGHTNVVNYQAHEVRRQANGVGWDILIQMELLTPLDQYLANHPLTYEDVVNLGISVCKALERCQKLDIIHRDVKPGNIFISEQGDFKLGDFGIARTAERTMSGMSRKGTYTYMAPEIHQGKAYNRNVDIYSLGLVLYRLLNNNRGPFMPPYPEKVRYQDSEQALIRRMRGDSILPPKQDQGKLAEIVLKACAFDPKERYAHPEEMREDLEALLWQAKHPTQEEEPPEEPPRNQKWVPEPDHRAEDQIDQIYHDIEQSLERELEDERTVSLWGEPAEKEPPQKENAPVGTARREEPIEESKTISWWGTGRRKKQGATNAAKATERPKKVQEQKKDKREWFTDLGVAVTIVGFLVAVFCLLF